MTTFDRTIYFNSVRESLFSGHMSQSQVDGQGFILDAWEQHASYHDIRWLAYFLATAFHETSKEMQPIEEYGKGGNADYAKPDPTTGECYYGRGYVQLTWADNYKRADTEFQWDGDKSCYLHPELQLDAFTAALTGYRGMMEGWFRSDSNGRQTLDRYFNDTVDDAYTAREIINGDKKTVPSWSNGVSIGNLIRGYHNKFMDALSAAKVDSPPPQPTPEEPEVVVIQPAGVKVTIKPA